MESQTRSAIAARLFGTTGRWKGKQRANAHYLHEKGLTPDEISHLLGLPIQKIVATIKRCAIACKTKPYRPPDW